MPKIAILKSMSSLSPIQAQKKKRGKNEKKKNNLSAIEIDPTSSLMNLSLFITEFKEKGERWRGDTKRACSSLAPWS